MVDQGLAAPFIVAAAVLAYGLGVASLLLLQSAARRRTARARAATRLRHPSRSSLTVVPAALVVSLSLALWSVAMAGAWAVLQ